ncbi:MAG: hypothetical protein C0502_02600 [Opitutus sp.]|nr:hypothetical protein [Opitutus sp.]
MLPHRVPNHTRRPFDRITGWTLERFTRLPAGSRKVAVLGIAVAVAIIGVLDYATGTRISMVIFYLIPVAVACAWLGRTAGVVTALASFLIRFVADATDNDATLHDTWLWWNSLAGAAVYLVTVWMLDALIRFHRQLEDRVRMRTSELEEETRKRQQAQRQLLELSAGERSAMGRELHDQLGQHLVATAMAAEVLAQRLQGRGETGSTEARKIAELLEQAVAQTRQLAHGLLLTQLPPSRLGSEFEELCATLRQQCPRIACECRVETRLQVADAGSAAQLFRIGQEALRNALRHSGASSVVFTLADEGPDLVLTVRDDGKGLPSPELRPPGLGLSIMQHRAEHLGARLKIESTPGQGTVITCRVPLAAASSTLS